MLLFIATQQTVKAQQTHSNTSHVIVYRRYAQRNGNRPRNSNTSHVIVYRRCCPKSRSRFRNSNTSHVIVYPCSIVCAIGIIVFKYISCYCLSFIPDGDIIGGYGFKYISCYCLSSSQYSITYSICIQIHLMLLFIVKSEHLRQNLPDSNTSHVIVYLRWCLFLYILHDDSNTSHVIVYPYAPP